MKESQSMEQFVSDVFGGRLIPVVETFPAQLYLLLPSFSPDITGTPFIRHTEWKYINIVSLHTIRSYKR